jgi:hypothetical protein
MSTMQWETLEHTYYEKTNDWYASVIIIAAALMVVELMTKNYLLMTLTFIGAFTFILLATRRPDTVLVEIRKNGIRFGNTLYPYQTLDGFAIIDYTNDRRLLLESNRKIMPLIVIHLPDDMDTEELNEVLEEYLPEKELHESLPHLLLERVGF